MTKKHSTKRAFIVSLLTLCLSFTMLLGTTYAWFTDSVSSTGNVIKSGRLDVGFYWADGATDPANTTWTSADKGAIFNNDLWEPGYTETKHIKITNEGTLSLAYKLAIIPHGEVSELADVIEVYYVAGATQVKDRTKLADDTALDSKYIGTLRDLIKNGIAAGTLEATDDNTTPADETEYTATIVLKMAEEAGNDYQGKSIGTDFSIQLLATQNTSEKDNFGTDYDKNAYFVVKNYAELKNAIDQALDTTTIFVQAGKYEFENVITMSDKEITIVGLGVVDFVKKTNYQSHLFNIADDSVVTIKNINMDGNGFAREGVFVRNNSTVTLENCYIGNTGGLDIMIDEASDNAHGKTTTSTVYLKNSHVEDVAMCASPTNNLPARQDTYAKFNFDAESSVVVVEKQSICEKPENCYINDDNSTDAYEFVFYAANDEQLADVLDRIETNAAYYNKAVLVKLAAGEYSEDYTINQYPLWNGVVGAGDSANNYASGVTGAAYTNITFAGQTATTYAANAVAVPDVVFTGNVTVKGFGNAGTGFGTATATTTFKNVGFDASESADEPKVEDAVVVYVVAAANDVNFESCYFTNATHVTVGGSKANGVGEVNFDKCYFDNGGCLSGYAETLTVTNTTVVAADNGFISNSKAGTVTVENCTVNAGKYFLRTSNSGIDANVTNTTVTLYESEGLADLVNFRGSNESATFTDCVLPEDYNTNGVDFNSKLIVPGDLYVYVGADGVKYYANSEGKIVLYQAQAFEGEEFVIPEGVEVLGTKCFQNMTNLKKVVLPESLETVGWSAFSGCTSLESVVIPGDKELLNRTTGGSHAHTFASCTSLSSVTIEEGVTMIPSGCFVSCTALTTVTIPSTVNQICKKAFYDCLALDTVYILSEDVTIESQAFDSNQKVYYDNMTIYVLNENVKAAVEATLGGNNKSKVTVKVMDNIIDSNEELTAAINAANDGDEIIVGEGTYTLKFTNDTTFNVANLTITGVGNVKINVTSTEVGYGRILGDNVTFNNIDFNGSKGNKVGATGKATYNHCKFYSLELASSNAAETYVNNCEMVQIHTDFDTNAGAAYVTGSNITVAEYNARNTLNFTDCVVGEFNVWGGNTVVTNCEFAYENINILTSAACSFVVDGMTYVSDGLYTNGAKNYYVFTAAGLKAFNDMMAAQTAGKGCTLTLANDIDFTGYTWTPVDSHADTNSYISKIDGQNHTISNLTINGQAMFTRFAGFGDVEITNLTFDGANVNSNGNLNTSILTVQSYQNLVLDNVDVKNSTIIGGYKVAALVGTVYNESSSTVTATIKNCDIDNCTIKSTKYDYFTCGIVAFVNAGDNDAIVFENTTISNTTISTSATSYNLHAFIYCTTESNLVNEAAGVTVTNCKFE